MSVECFLDTNVLVYAAASGEIEREKRQTALRLIDETEFGLSAQILQEFYVTIVRKAEVPMTPVQALEWLEQLRVFPCADIDADLVMIAVEISERHRISYWDGAILAAAENLKAPILYSEDLNHQQLYGSVRVVNPFSRD